MQRGQNPGQSAKPEYVLKRANGSFVINCSMEIVDRYHSFIHILFFIVGTYDIVLIIIQTKSIVLWETTLIRRKN